MFDRPLLAIGMAAASSLTICSTAFAAQLAHGPRPLEQNAWIGQGDYPATALRSEIEGLVDFTIGVDAQGKPVRCTIEKGSGNVELDRQTCDLLVVRARFEPARDANGRAVEGSFSSRVNWMLGAEPHPEPQTLILTYLVDEDGSVFHCEIVKSEGKTEWPADMPCPFSRVKPYLDATGKPVAKRVRTNWNIIVSEPDQADRAHVERYGKTKRKRLDVTG